MGGVAQSTIDPWFLSLRLSAREMRAGPSADWAKAPSPAGPLVLEGGVVPTPALSGLGCISNGTSGAPRLRVSAGQCIIPDTNEYGWDCTWPIDTDILMTVPPGSNPRTDLVVARVYSVAEFTDALTGFYIEIIDGAPAASPSPPSVPALRAIPLWNANITTAGVVTLTSRRQFTRGVGGTRLRDNDSSRNGSYPGDLRIDRTTGQVDAWIGGTLGAEAWNMVAQKDTGWTAWTPVLMAANGGSPTAVVLGTGGSAGAVGRFRIVGKTCYLHASFQAGTSGADGKFGNITMALPPGVVAATSMGEQMLTCKTYVQVFGGTFTGSAFIAPGGAVANPYFRISSTNHLEQPFLNASSSGAVGTGCPIVGGGLTWGNQNNFTIWGTVEIN